MTVKHVLASVLTIASLLIFLTMQGCALLNGGKFEHGIAIANFEKEPVYDITILYGEKTLKFPGRTSYSPGGASLWNAGMPIPAEMTVIWHVDNAPERRVTIALKDKIAPFYQLANWRVRFYGERIELWREDNVGPIDRNTTLIQRKTEKVFPYE